MRPAWFAKAACAWAIGAAAIAEMALLTPAVAEVTRVVVTDSGSMGTFGGREYTWVAAHMEGTVARDDGTTGHYRVPVSLNYPDRDSNGFGFVDVVNNADFSNFTDQTAPLGKRSVSYPGGEILSDYLRREGFTYLSVQWSRMAVDVLGPDYGVIENGLDGWEIVKDASRFLREPRSLAGSLPLRPEAVEWVIGFGYSQSGRLLRQLVRTGQNREADGTLVFDGLLAGGATRCGDMTNDETPRSVPQPTLEPTDPTFFTNIPCDDPFPEDGKFINIITQSELEDWVLDADRNVARHETPSYRQYELAGVSHIPEERRSLRQLGAMRQNPVGFRPVFRAMLHHLVEWIVAGKEPPPPLYIEGTADADGRLLATDADGNVLGGVRLPHMATLLPNAEPAGAPLGVYGGLDLELDRPGFGFADAGGTFEPFSPEELARRYPTQESYVDLVRRAAAALLADSYILAEDHDAYIRAAERQPLAPVPIDPVEIIAGTRATLEAVGE